MGELDLLLTITVALVVAFIGGLTARAIRLSPIVGYVITGVLVGPYTPGFVANQLLAAQMAELGVVLLMFGVGLRFRLRDLWQVRRIALPGALAQSALATAITAALAVAIGWDWGQGVVLGVALAVSSTVVMTRVLSDEDLLDTPAGHLAVGWTVTEDFITVIALVLLPPLVGSPGDSGLAQLVGAVGLALVKVAFVTALLLLVGTKAVPRLLLIVARTRSAELFTLSVLVVVLVIATVSATFFGFSLALGAFLAGIVVSYSRLSVQAAADALPLRDAFAVLFFVSIGMLFDPRLVIEHSGLLLVVAGAVLLVKPVGALLITLLLGSSFTAALTVAFCIAQIGEFSFVMAEVGRRTGILPQEGYSALVAASLLSIALNPLLARVIKPVELALRRRPRLWDLLNWRAEARAARACAPQKTSAEGDLIIVGYGPVGRHVHRIAEDFGLKTVIIEMNPDTVNELAAQGTPAIFGDAARREVLEVAGINRTRYLVVTLPDIFSRIAVIATARLEAPDLEIITRARYLQERVILEESGASIITFEEAEAAVALAAAVLRRLGSSPEAIDSEATRIRQELGSELRLPRLDGEE